MTKDQKHQENQSNYNHGYCNFETYKRIKKKIDSMFLTIKCKSGVVFAATVEIHADAEWYLEQDYYKALGCTTGRAEEVKWGGCECDHCKSLEHDFENR